MTHRHLLLFAAPVVLALCAALIWQQERLAHPGALEAHFLDVGQGDSTLLVTPSGRQIVIDGGPSLATLPGLGRWMPFFDRTIDLLILSHVHLDHLSSFPEILRRYHVGAVLMTGVETSLPRYQEFLTLIREQHIPVIVPDPAHDLDMGDGVVLDVVWPHEGLMGAHPKEQNNNSVVVRARYGSSAILFTGDMEIPEEQQVLASHQDMRATILKIAHHGSKTSSSTGFLLAVHPSLAIVSVGAVNTYGHPSASVIARLAQLGIPTRLTSKEGEIDVELKR